MALRIPVSLMNTVAAVHQPTPSTRTEHLTAIRPSSDSEGINPTAEDGRQFANIPQNAASPIPQAATPTSVVAAQTSQHTAPETAQRKPHSKPEKMASELDRFAPPDPLPTAPILLAASKYAAERATE